MEVRIIGKPNEIADLLERIEGRQNIEVPLDLDAQSVTKAVLESIRDTSEGAKG